jgi:hypothetical protein
VIEWEGNTYNEVVMRIVLTQSSQEFHSRYGEPDLERFIARPGIGLTIQHGSDHLACQVLIEPRQPLIYTEENVPLMSSESVTEILEGCAIKNAGQGNWQNCYGERLQ